MFHLKRQLLPLLLFFVFISLVGCNQNSQKLSQNEETDGEIHLESNHPFDVNTYALNKLVCDPMGGGGAGINDGLIATLFYLDSSQPHYNKVSDYIEYGTQSNKTLFFSELNIPTRRFELGFPSETGDLIKDDLGNDLNEYFAIRFQSVLKLSESDLAGDYELALLSDDGTVMKVVGEDGEYQVVVDNDGNHPTRMGCGETISLDATSEVDVQIDYYQGPRYHISLIPMWRRVDEFTQNETQCGKRGNSMYFDFNNNSTPQQAYLDMLTRGWKPIAQENWHLPPSAIFNPCSPGQLPIISDLNIRAVGEGFVVASWTTDLPATSQVLYKDSSGNETLTTSDNILRTSHSIVLSQGLSFGETYTMHAVSISADMGKVLSRPVSITVQ